jgi:hypothetical protein
MYVSTEDNQGNDSLFFRILLSDKASNPATLFDKTQRIKSKVLEAIRASELGLETYFNFRSESEQAMLRDPFWERS